MIVVVDASVALALLLGEPQGEVLEPVLRQVQEGSARVCIPMLFWYEVSNVLLVASRRAARIPEPMKTLLADADDLPFETDVEMTPRIRARMVELASRHNLTVYDAAYIELADRRKARRLLTLDKALLSLSGEYAFLRG